MFLLPWALVYRNLGLFGFLEMAVFLGILFVGFAYVWVKGDLDWDKPRPTIPRLNRTAEPQVQNRNVTEEIPVNG